MTSVVMVASFASEKQSFLRKAGAFAATPFTWTWGKIKTNPKKAAATALTAGTGLAAYKLNYLSSEKAYDALCYLGNGMCTLGGKALSYAPSKEQALTFITHPKVLASAFVLGGLAYVYSTYAKAKKKAAAKPSKEQSKVTSSASVKLTTPEVQQFSCASATVKTLKLNNRVITLQQKQTAVYEIGHRNNPAGVFVIDNTTGMLLWVSRDALETLSKEDRNAILDAQEKNVNF